MKVRVRSHPDGLTWVVETKRFPFFWVWEFEQSFSHNDAETRAVQYAQRLANPKIIEFKSK